jgi:hypothetical protein
MFLYALFIVPFLIMGFLVDYTLDEYDYTTKNGGYKATAVFLVTLAAWYFFIEPDVASILVWVRTNVVTLLIAAVAYFAIGAVWGVIKWRLYLDDLTSYIRTRLDTFKAKYGISLKSREEKDEFASKVRTNVWRTAEVRIDGNNPDYVITFTPPHVNGNMDLVLRWMTFWPVSITWTLLNNPVRKIFIWIFRSMSGVMQRMANDQFSKI